MSSGQNSESCVGSGDGFDPIDAIMTVIDLSDTVQPEEKEEIKQWIKEKKELRVVVTGKTGSGKSSLLNSFVGHKVFEEGSDLDPGTMEVTQHEFEKDGVRVIAWDCPGLQDGRDDEEKYLQTLVEKTNRDIDLIFYCIDMSDKRAIDHKSAIKKLTETLGPKIWSNTVIALTFANEFVNRLQTIHPGIKGEDLVENFKVRIELWRSKAEEALRELGIPEDVAKALPVFPAGYHTQLHLPGYRYWASHMWIKTLFAVKECAQPLPIIMNASRFREQPPVDEEESLFLPEQQPIYYNIVAQANPNVNAQVGAAEGGAGGIDVNDNDGLLRTGQSIGSTTGMVIGGVVGYIASNSAYGALLGITVGQNIGLQIGGAIDLLVSVHRRRRQNIQQ